MPEAADSWTRPAHQNGAGTGMFGGEIKISQEGIVQLPKLFMPGGLGIGAMAPIGQDMGTGSHASSDHPRNEKDDDFPVL